MPGDRFTERTPNTRHKAKQAATRANTRSAWRGGTAQEYTTNKFAINLLAYCYYLCYNRLRKKEGIQPEGVIMIYYRVSYSNECTCHGMPIRGINEYIAFRTLRAVCRYINNIKKNYSYYMFYEIAPALIDDNAPQFKIYN